MNTKYTLEITIPQSNPNFKNPFIRLMPIVSKSIRESKKIVKDLEAKTAIIKNKRGEPIHEYTEGEGWFKTFQKNKTKIKMAWLYGRQCY